jgi:hypothetical protein
MKCPCYKCVDRHVFEHATCHASCPRYKEWRVALDARKAAEADAGARDFILDSIERKRRHKNDQT